AGRGPPGRAEGPGGGGGRPEPAAGGRGGTARGGGARPPISKLPSRWTAATGAGETDGAGGLARGTAGAVFCVGSSACADSGGSAIGAGAAAISRGGNGLCAPRPRGGAPAPAAGGRTTGGGRR